MLTSHPIPPPNPPQILRLAPQQPMGNPPIPPPTLGDNRVVNVIEMTKCLSEDEKLERAEIMLAIKRTRCDNMREDLEGPRETNTHGIDSSKEKGEFSKRPRKSTKSKRKISIGDFPFGIGHDSYDLSLDLGTQKPNITYPQLLELSPSLRKQWAKLSSSR